MTAPIIPIQRGREIKAERIALAKFEALCELAEELEAVAPDCLDEVCRDFVDNGWVSEADIRMARELMEAGR